MSDVKVNIYTTNGQHIGYFLNPNIEAFPDGDYQLTGRFHDGTGTPIVKMEFNPEAVPYVADLSDVKGVEHKRLHKVYLQRGRQPVVMTGSANPALDTTFA